MKIIFISKTNCVFFIIAVSSIAQNFRSSKTASAAPASTSAVGSTPSALPLNIEFLLVPLTEVDQIHELLRPDCPKKS